MLSCVLRSPRAVQVNIEIMRTFVRLREMLQGNAELARKLAALEQKYDAQFRVVFDAIRQLMAPPSERTGSHCIATGRGVRLKQSAHHTVQHASEVLGGGEAPLALPDAVGKNAAVVPEELGPEHPGREAEPISAGPSERRLQ
jgi:hypothetical protein